MDQHRLRHVQAACCLWYALTLPVGTGNKDWVGMKGCEGQQTDHCAGMGAGTHAILPAIGGLECCWVSTQEEQCRGMQMLARLQHVGKGAAGAVAEGALPC